ncbi:ALI_collapsed_G0005590.mRNA.1.CDS.1 [Saccharomyces cerevisiae]|nr:ALI_collapsed_G0005590.mRNA.1.CDS.1 [Saccharomyces cerevisiae]
MEKDLSSLYSEKKDKENDETLFNIKLSKSVVETTPLNGHSLFDDDKSLSDWTDNVFTQSVFYHGNKLNAIIFDKLGTSCFESVDISSNSQYYPAIENLSPSDQESNVKKCIAVILLQRYPLLSPSDLSQILFVSSTLLDVIYENNESTIELNNRLVFHLGEQLEQLFNPVTEYSPEQTEYGYKAPEDELPTESDDDLVKAICNELLQLQTNFTFNLVEFLQKFLIALRVRVLNEEINGLSTTKLNRLFPPTIDEVTRINCIFLDSLKTAIPYGSLEVLKACSITIPYFYKAYTRHEAATKNFSKDIKLFIRHFSNVIPEREVYTEMKIESIIKGPQEKLLKLKLIIERLWKSKKWRPKNQELAKKCYNNIIDVIDSFGKLDSPLHSYSTRVFTPSGKSLQN